MDKDTIEYYLSTLETEGRNLTKWEEDFLRSIRHQFDINRSLSEKQLEILERIYAEKTPT